jgi:CRP-like cAMP-binding protein
MGVAVDPGALRAVPLFAALRGETAERVAGATTVRTYRPGAFVFVEGEPAARFHFVLEGRVRVFRGTEDGHEQTLQVLGPGGLLAVVCVLPDQAYPASAEAVVLSRVGSLPTAELARLAQAHGDLAWALIQQLARRLVWAQGRIYDLALRSATARVVAALVDFARQHGRPSPGEPGVWVVDVPVTHREIGQLTGVSRETVTRTLGVLRAQGLVSVVDGRLRLELDRLAAWREGRA